MKNLFQQLTDKYFDRKLEFRVRLFNLLAMAGMCVSAISAAVSLSIGEHPSVGGVYISSCALSLGLMEYARRSGRYQLCYMITIVLIFLVGFPAFFFLSFAYYSAMPFFFIFAVVFTAFMLPGRKALFFAALELAVYTGVCLYAHYYVLPPDFSVPDETYMVICIFGFTVVSTALGLCMHFLFRLYNAQQALLSEQNKMLEQVSRMKTELLANISHEMKTPLTVISVHIQRAQALTELGRPGDGEKICESFVLAQDEIMRLSRMVSGVLELSSLPEPGSAAAGADAAAILRAAAEAYRVLLEKGGNTLLIDLPEALPPLSVSADALIQMVSNLLSNAGAHTRNGEIRIGAVREGGCLLIRIRDTGSGVSSDLLPRIFERGVSGRGGSGLGLAICRELSEACGGGISIENAPGAGAVATLTLPLEKEAAFRDEVRALAR